MNKLKVINIIRNFIELYINNNLNYQTSSLVIRGIKEEEFSEEILALKECELITYILKVIPYYQIIDFLNELAKYIKCLNLYKEYNVALLIEPYLEDLKIFLNYRINTEVKAHILTLLTYYVSNYNFNSITILDTIQQNIVSPEDNTGYSSLTMIQNQEKFESISYEGEELREVISKNSYSERNKYYTRIKTILIKMDENSFNSFIDNIEISLNKFLLTEPKLALNLIKLYTNEFDLLKEIYTFKKKKQHTRQLSLFDNI